MCVIQHKPYVVFDYPEALGGPVGLGIDDPQNADFPDGVGR